MTFRACLDYVVALIMRFDPCGEGYCLLVRSGRGRQSRRSCLKGASSFHALRSIIFARRRCAVKERTVLSLLALGHIIEGSFVASPYIGRLPSHRIERTLCPQALLSFAIAPVVRRHSGGRHPVADFSTRGGQGCQLGISGLTGPSYRAV